MLQQVLLKGTGNCTYTVSSVRSCGSKQDNSPLARGREACEPDSHTGLLGEILALLMGEVLVPGDVGSHLRTVYGPLMVVTSENIFVIGRVLDVDRISRDDTRTPLLVAHCGGATDSQAAREYNQLQRRAGK